MSQALHSAKCSANPGGGHVYEFHQPMGAIGNTVSRCRFCNQPLPGSPAQGVPPRGTRADYERDISEAKSAYALNPSGSNFSDLFAAENALIRHWPNAIQKT